MIAKFISKIAVFVCAALAFAQFTARGAESSAEITVKKISYHGWENCLRIANGVVEADIAPAVGRVMQFRWSSDEDGPLWENRALDGRPPDAQSKDWGNFGGDKTWPAPQSDWPKVTPRSWPPPPAFDSTPVDARVEGDAVILVSAVDPYYGIRTHRTVRLEPGRPVMTIRTIYEKVEGEPRRVGIWTITQLKDPAGVFAPVPANSIFPKGFSVTSKEPPPDVKVENGLLSLTRDPKAAHKIGNDSGTLIWVGGKWAVRIDSPRVAGGEYSHSGNSAEIFTNTDAAPYVELELLGPMSTMKAGDKIERSNRYTLFRNEGKDNAATARRILEIK